MIPTSATRSILSYGRRKPQVNHPGQLLGGQDVPGGILNVPQWQLAYWVTPSISTAVAAICSPDALRVYLAQHHYRQPWNFDRAALTGAATIAEELGRAAAIAVPNASTSAHTLATESLLYEFAESMDDDLNTPLALQTLHALATQINSAAANGWSVRVAQQQLQSMGRVFGLRLSANDPEQRVREGWQRYLPDFRTN